MQSVGQKKTNTLLKHCNAIYICVCVCVCELYMNTHITIVF